ncbi:hypothetical protein, partial [Tenacibaculum ovolyticum]|uniref:hypothetical protein n=1 Tax=Tenacibaculum ovolyticum TaxID=104270 RepID=UPI00048FFA10
MLGKNEKTIKIKNFNIHVEELAPHETPEYIAQRIQQATIEILDKLEAKKQLDAYLNSNEERGTNNSPQQVSVTNKKKENPKRETSKPGASVLINTAKISSSFKETPSIKKETSKSNKDFGVTKKANKITNDTGFGFANKKQITISSNEELVNAYQALNGVSNNNEVLVKTIKERYLNEKAVTYDARKVKYWKETIKKIEEGTPVVALIKQPEHKELKKVYDEIIVNAKEGEKLTKKKLRNFIINEIEEKYIANKKTTSKKLSYWTAILGQLKNANFSLESILSNNEELFLFLDLLTDVDFDVLPKDLLKINASVYPSFRNLYPKNLSSSKIYAVLNKLTDKTGRSVSKVTKDKKGIKHLKDTSIKFAANIKNPNINWKIYKKDGSLLHTFVDIGEEFSFTFAEYGEFVVEAYGNKAEYKKGKYAKAKKNNKSYIAIHIKKPALTSILVKENATKNLMIRLEESLTFVATADVGENSSIPLITWYMCYKSAKKEKYTEEEITNAKGVTEFKQLFNKKGIYTIKAVSESITKEVTFKVGNNYPNAISVDKSWVLYNTQQSFNCKVIAYRMNPVTAEEINQTKWVVFKDEKIYIPKGLQKIDNKPYVATGNCFNFVPHEAGNYVVESYMNYSSYNSSKKLTNACKSIKVVQPQVTKANWADSSGLLKLQTGYQKQVKNYINASIPNYNNKPIIVGVYEDVGYKKLIGSYNTQTDKNGNINLQLCLRDDTAITKFIATSKATTVAIYFNIQAKGYTLKKSIANSKLSKIIVSKEPKIIRSYFMYDGNIISSHLQAVPYGTKITFIAETTNIIGQKIKLELYRTEAADNYNGKQITENNNVVV